MLRLAGGGASLPPPGRGRNREGGFDCFFPSLTGDAPVTLPGRGRVDATRRCEASSGRAAGWGDGLSPRTVPEWKDHPTPPPLFLPLNVGRPPPPTGGGEG